MGKEQHTHHIHTHDALEWTHATCRVFISPLGRPTCAVLLFSTADMEALVEAGLGCGGVADRQVLPRACFANV
jgi:hypothetical protein